MNAQQALLGILLSAGPLRLKAVHIAYNVYSVLFSNILYVVSLSLACLPSRDILMLEVNCVQ